MRLAYDTGVMQTNELEFAVILTAAVGCGVNAGVFFAFSTFVMKALARLSAAQGIAVMQSINVAAITPLFMAALFGTALVCALLAISALSIWPTPRAVYLLVGSLLYLTGTILVTIVCNVPRNNWLATVDPASADGARLWADFLAGWTAWNHVRTVAALGASVSLTIALYGS